MYIKPNMIIPQIKSARIDGNETANIGKSLKYVLYVVEIQRLLKDKETEVLMCTNDSCKGKLLGKLTHFVSKAAMNIERFS